MSLTASEPNTGLSRGPRRFLLREFLLGGFLLFGWLFGADAFAQAVTLPSHARQASVELGWKPLESLPDQFGVAGAYAGIHAGRLLVAGGAHFPQLPPWQGGSKVWVDRVWAMDLDSGKWVEAGKLPRPLGYGVSISTEQGLVCLGGSDSRTHHRECFWLNWTAAGLETRPLPDLPRPLANAAGALLGQTIYLCGGTDSPTANRPRAELWRLDLLASEPKWEQLPDCPGGPRLLPVAAADADSFFLFGGADLKTSAAGKAERVYCRDAWAYSAAQGWRPLAAAPVPIVAAPSPAALLSSGEILIVGGDTGEHVGFQPPEQHPGFSRKLLLYDRRRDEWQTLPEEAPVARVTTPLVRGKTGWLLISGEQRPGVRSPEIWLIEEAPR